MQIYFLATWGSLLTYLAFAFRPWNTLINRIYRRVGEWLVFILLLPFLVTVNFQPDPGDLLRLLGYLLVPTFLLRLRPRNASFLDIFRTLAIISIWFPVEFNWLPDQVAPFIGEVTLPVVKLTAILLALFLFIIHDPLKDLGYTFRFKIADFRLSGLGLLLFGLVGIPIGLGTGFLQFNANFPNVNGFAFALIGGYLLIALPEELLFRGIIQNILTRQVRNERLGLGIAAVIFGLSHLNNSTPGFPTPNWMYAGMAALAGLAYGWVWQRTGKVTASAITHALVNLLWGILLS